MAAKGSKRTIVIAAIVISAFSVLILNDIGHFSPVMTKPIQHDTKTIQETEKQISLESCQSGYVETISSDRKWAKLNVTKHAKTQWAQVMRNDHGFQEDILQCSIPVNSNKYHITKLLPKRMHSLTTCTPSVFKDYYKTHQHFLSEGAWYIPKDRSMVNAAFLPDICAFNETATSREGLKQCFRNKKIKRVLIQGDSHGDRYTTAILKFLQRNSYTCEVLRREDQSEPRKPRKLHPYFRVPGKPIIQRSIDRCRTCLSRTFNCSSPQNGVLLLEYIGVTRMIDDLLWYMPNATHLDRKSFLEYLLRDYFPHYGYPDLWIMSPPFYHEARWTNVSMHTQNMAHFSRLIQTYKPASSRLLILSGRRECIAYQPWEAVQLYMPSHGKNFILHGMNQVLFDAIRPLLINKKMNIHGFLDMSYVTCPVVCRWHVDGTHMLPDWYELMSTYIFQFICSESD